MILTPPRSTLFLYTTLFRSIGVYESVQKFGSLITSGKFSNGADVSKVAELLSHASAFYDAEMIAGIINAMLYNTRDKIVERSEEHRLNSSHANISYAVFCLK